MLEGRDGNVRPVRGMVHFASSDVLVLMLEGVSEVGDSVPSSMACVRSLFAFDSSSFDASTTRSGNGGESKGREFVSRNRHSRVRAFTASRNTTTRQRIVSPFRRAAISQRSSVYWIICRSVARRRYVGLVLDQYFV